MKKIITIFMALAFFSMLKVESIDFQVGEDKGWAIPPSNDTNRYNEWASKNRFNVNDTLYFKYKKDSVLVVTKEEYGKCKSSHPIFFSNNGDTSFELNRSGFFYFISGVSGHCERGLKMIVKVLEREIIAQPTNQTSTKSEAVSLLRVDGVISFQTIMIIGIVSMFGVFFV